MLRTALTQGVEQKSQGLGMRGLRGETEDVANMGLTGADVEGEAHRGE